MALTMLDNILITFWPGILTLQHDALPKGGRHKLRPVVVTYFFKIFGSISYPSNGADLKLQDTAVAQSCVAHLEWFKQVDNSSCMPMARLFKRPPCYHRGTIPVCFYVN